MLVPIATYLLRVNRDTWARFKARIEAEGHTARWVLESLIEDYIANGRRPPTKKDKDKTDA